MKYLFLLFLIGCSVTPLCKNLMGEEKVKCQRDYHERIERQHEMFYDRTGFGIR